MLYFKKLNLNRKSEQQCSNTFRLKIKPLYKVFIQSYTFLTAFYYNVYNFIQFNLSILNSEKLRTE